jgi:cellulose binding protein with CBM2 domain/fibronectin type III domain protein
MPTSRFRTLLTAILLAAGASVLAAGPAGAAPTPSPTSRPSPSPSAPTHPTDYPPTPSSSAPTHPTDYPPTPSSSTPGPTDPATPPVGPTGPTDLRATTVTTGSVTLAWSPATPGNHPIARYDITYTQAFNDLYWSQSATSDATTAFVANGIRPTGQYSFWITAVDTYGLRSTTGASLRLVIPASDTAADRTPPTAPTGLTVAGSGPGGAVLTWTPSTDDVALTGYTVYRFDGLYVSTPVASVPGPTATVPGTSGMQVYYVRARDASGNLSAVSNSVSVPGTPTTPPAPTCSVTYRTSSQWAGGFVADLEITNRAATAVNDWRLTFEFGGDQTISSTWGATADQNGANVSLTPAAWNQVIPAGRSVTVGMLGRWSTSAAPPTSAHLNGAACALG